MTAGRFGLMARDVAEVLRAEAARVDQEGVFPDASVKVLRESGLLGLTVPPSHGGLGGSPAELAGVLGTLAGGCVSTAMVLGMHLQQVAVLAAHAQPALRDRVLPEIAAGRNLVASVTSERGKGGHLMSAHAPLSRAGDDVVVVRDAPVVTTGTHADSYLLTMRADDAADPSDVRLVYVARDQVVVTQQGTWNALGMRGTESVPLTIAGTVPKHQLVHPEGGFRRVAYHTMIPTGHLAWSACWLGAARGAVAGMVRTFRDPASRGAFAIDSDLFAERLARIRLTLDVARAYVDRFADLLTSAAAAPGPAAMFDAPWFHIHVNNVKVVAAEASYGAVDALIQLAGLRHGYLKGQEPPLERVLRDLRSSRLMFGDDRLLLANGRLALLDRDVTSLPARP